MRENGFPKYYVTADKVGNELSLFARQITKEDYIFRSKALEYCGKKGQERVIYKQQLQTICDKYGVESNKLIYVTTPAAISAGATPYTKVRIDPNLKVNSSLAKPKWPLARDEAGILVEDMGQLSNAPDRAILEGELSSLYCRATESICSCAGPYVLLSPFIEYSRIDEYKQREQEVVIDKELFPASGEMTKVS